MQTLKELYKIGKGPSSSHTMGPERSVKRFLSEFPDCDKYKAILYGSLSKTGAGHGTDTVIIETFKPHKCEVVFDHSDCELFHENTLDLIGYKDGEEVCKKRFYSVGGGTILADGEAAAQVEFKYSHNSFTEIAK